MTGRSKQLTLWQLMKGITIAAILASALTPLVHRSDSILDNPGIFLAIMGVVFAIQFTISLLVGSVDWVLGNSDNKTDEKSEL